MSRAATLALLSLACSTLAIDSTRAQAPTGASEHDVTTIGRGDAHSKGWDAVMKAKGPPVQPKFPQVGTGIERHVLENGLVVYLAEDRALPLVRMDMAFRGGDAHESAEDQGLTSLTGGQMRDGGTEELAPEALDDRLAYLAATISTSFGDELGSASLNVLKKDLDEGLKLFADVVMRPRFDEERLGVAKRRRIFDLVHRNDDPGEIANRELATLLYGESHPRGRQLTPAHVERITRERLVAAHRRYVRPDNAVLAVVGDFTAADMLTRLRARFGAWQRGGPVTATLPTAQRTPRPGVFLIDRPVNQSSILIAHLGTNRDDPNRFAVTLMNDVLGGGSFTSRVTERVRSDEGLAYSAGTRYPTGSRDLGTFAASVQTKTSTTGKAVASILDEIRRMHGGGSLSRNEFEAARESALYSQVFRFEDLGDSVGRLMRYELEGRPADTDRQEYEGLARVTAADVETVARTYLRPEELTILVVGDGKEIAKALEAFGPVTVITPAQFAEPGRGERAGTPRGM
jgi:predicted Zn-dependent peptidase